MLKMAEHKTKSPLDIISRIEISRSVFGICVMDVILRSNLHTNIFTDYSEEELREREKGRHLSKHTSRVLSSVMSSLFFNS